MRNAGKAPEEASSKDGHETAETPSSTVDFWAGFISSACTKLLVYPIETHQQLSATGEESSIHIEHDDACREAMRC